MPEPKWVYVVEPARSMDDGDSVCFGASGDAAWDRAIEYIHLVAEDRDDDWTISLHHREAEPRVCALCNREDCPSRAKEYEG